MSLAKSHHQTDKVSIDATRKKEPDIKQNLTIKMIENSEEGLESTDQLITYSLADIHTEVYHLFHKSFDFSVKIYFPNQFEALRKVYCGAHSEFINSVFRSEVWKDNSGGKTKSPFLKSHDHKYVIKVVRHSEVKMFETMSDNYFEYMCRSFTQQQPTAMSKILGIYRIRQRSGTDGKVT